MKHRLLSLLAVASTALAFTAQPLPAADPPAPAPKHAMGWHSGPPSKLRQFIHHPAFSAVNVPDQDDLSGTMPGFTPTADAAHNDAIYDQLQKGSCTAHAGKRCFNFIWHKTYGTFFDGSREGVYTCSLIHDHNWPQDAGSTTGTVVWVLTNQGLGPEQCFPYSKPVSAKLPACYLPAAKNQLLIHAYDVDNTDHISIMVAINKARLPVMYGGYVYQSIESLDAKNYFNAPRSGRPIGGHERTIMGYNRTLKHTYPNGKTVTGFYWVANSWNVTWGYHGYSWEPMADVENSSINNDFAVLDGVKRSTTTSSTRRISYEGELVMAY